MKLIYITILMLISSLSAQENPTFEIAMQIIGQSEIHFKLQKRVKKLKYMEDGRNNNRILIMAYEDRDTHIVRLETLKVEKAKLYILIHDDQGNEKWKLVKEKKVKN